MRANRDGTFTVVVDKLDRPTSMEIVGDIAYVVTLTGEVLRIDNLSGSPPGQARRDEGPGPDQNDRRGNNRAEPSNPFFDDGDKGHRSLFA